MKSPRIASIVSLFLVLSCAQGWSQLAVKGRLILEEPFTIPATYTKEYQPAQPGWRAKAWQQMWAHSGPGMITSKWTAGHMPVFALEGTFNDFVVELEFRYHKIEGQKALCRSRQPLNCSTATSRNPSSSSPSHKPDVRRLRSTLSSDKSPTTVVMFRTQRFCMRFGNDRGLPLRSLRVFQTAQPKSLDMRPISPPPAMML